MTGVEYVCGFLFIGSVGVAAGIGIHELYKATMGWLKKRSSPYLSTLDR